MIRCNLSRILGEQRLKISDVSSATGINRGTLTRLYYDEAERVELVVLDKLCDHLNVKLTDLLERVSGDFSDETKA